MNIVSFCKSLYLNFTWQWWPIWRLRKSGAKIGKQVFIGQNCYVELENAHLLTIEDGVVVAALSKIILHDSSLNNINGFDLLFGRVTLKRNCYIGADVTLLPGSTVGESTIVGAGSLVKGELKSNSVYVGRPAKLVGNISDLTKKWTKLKNDSNEQTRKSIFFLAKKSPYLVKD